MGNDQKVGSLEGWGLMGLGLVGMYLFFLNMGVWIPYVRGIFHRRAGWGGLDGEVEAEAGVYICRLTRCLDLRFQ